MKGSCPRLRNILDILTLLDIPRGIVVINKADLVEEEWLDLMEEEIREELKETAFREAPICKVVSPNWCWNS